MKDRVYLDYNCFQRSFDDIRQTRIRLEAAACERIFQDAENGDLELVWSFVHEDENRLCPFLDRKEEVRRLANLCAVRAGPNEDLRSRAKAMVEESGLSAKDALHLATARQSEVSFFITCDDDILKKSERLDLEMRVMGPVEYVLKEVER